MSLRYYEGSSNDALFLLDYLREKYTEQCVLLATLLQTKNTDISWEDVAFVWVNKNLRVPGGKYSLRTKVTDCRHRFILIPLVIVHPTKSLLHANFVILDLYRHCIERFESYGETPIGYQVGIKLDTALDRLGKFLLGPSATLERGLEDQKINIQLYQETERLMSKDKGDPAGYCLVWSAMYADMRLANPLREASSIPRLIFDTAKEFPGPMTDYIRQYTAHANRKRESIGKKEPSGADLLRFLMSKSQKEGAQLI